jgi:hypothetical protein
VNWKLDYHPAVIALSCQDVEITVAQRPRLARQHRQVNAKYAYPVAILAARRN